MKSIKAIWTWSVWVLLVWTSSVVFGEVYQAAPGETRSVALAWDPSPDSSVVGYRIYYGTQTGNWTNHIDVGSQISVTLAGFTPQTTNFLTVKAYDANQMESEPSNEIQYIAPGVPSPTLSTAVAKLNTKGVKLNFQATSGVEYRIEATEDFKNWTTVLTTNVPVSGPISLNLTNDTEHAQRFYRVAQY